MPLGEPGQGLSLGQRRLCTEPGLLTFELQRDQVQLELPALGLGERKRIVQETEWEKGKGERRGGRRRRREEGGREGRDRESGEREAAISSLNRAQRCRSQCSDMRAECR